MKEENRISKRKKLTLGVLITTIVVAVILITVLWLKKLPKEELNVQKGEESINTPDNEESNEKNVQIISTEDVKDDEDKVEDGLTNGEEKSLGTDFTNIDSDGDLLSDYKEIRIYNTRSFKS